MGYDIGYLLVENSIENGNFLVMLITLLFSFQSLTYSNTEIFYTSYKSCKQNFKREKWNLRKSYEKYSVYI